MEVCFYEAFAEECAALRRHLPPQVWAGFTPHTIQESGHTDPPARLISIRTQSIVPTAWYGNLAGILSRTTGYDTVAASPVPCGYLPLYCQRAVAEQALLLILALLRKLPQQLRQFARFDRDGLTGQEAAGKNLLVVGVGHVGAELAKLGQALGMVVRGVDLVERDTSVSYVSIAAGLPWADIIVCAMNLTRDNVGYFDHARLRQARRGALFVNVARGELAPAADLERLLADGCLGGVALDVYEQESELAVALRRGQAATDPTTPATLKLARRPNVILTPHNAFNTVEAVERKAAQTVQQATHFLAHREFLWPVPVGNPTGS